MYESNVCEVKKSRIFIEFFEDSMNDYIECIVICVDNLIHVNHLK